MNDDIRAALSRGGTIDITSTPGRGTQLTGRVPTAAARAGRMQ